MTTKPQDHKQPKDKPRRIEVMGATLTIDPSILDDLDMVEYLYDLQHAADSDDGGFTIVPFLRKLCGDDYAAGGGFPIALRGTGVIGSICVSGFDDHLDDHQLVINTLAEYLA